MCPSYSQPVIPGLTRNPETFATSDLHYHWHFWIPAGAGMNHAERQTPARALTLPKPHGKHNHSSAGPETSTQNAGTQPDGASQDTPQGRRRRRGAEGQTAIPKGYTQPVPHVPHLEETRRRAAGTGEKTTAPGVKSPGADPAEEAGAEMTGHRPGADQSPDSNDPFGVSKFSPRRNTVQITLCLALIIGLLA